jgi:hypothetical protein
MTRLPAPDLDERRAVQNPQLPGCGGESEPHARGKLLDAPFPLAKMLQQF